MWLQQPDFGRRLRALRTERGLSQQQLGGEEMSKAYVSRLESGAREATNRAVDYLSRRLEVPTSIFREVRTDSLSQALARAGATDDPERAIALVEEALGGAPQDDQTAERWQALRLLAEHHEKAGRRDDQIQTLHRMIEIADTEGIPETRYYSHLKMARAMRSEGDMQKAHTSAQQAFETAQANDLTHSDTARALMVLVSTESAIGNLAQAHVHDEELQKITIDLSPVLRTEALWTSAHVHLRQNDFAGAAARLDEALKLLNSREDLGLWLRLRLAGAAFNLEMSPRRIDEAQHCLTEAASAVSLIGSPLHQQEFTLLSAQLAVHRGDLEQARKLKDQLDEGFDRLAYQDQIAARVLDNQLRILHGERGQGIAALQELAENAERRQNADLAKEIWRTLAETLARSDKG